MQLCQGLNDRGNTWINAFDAVSVAGVNTGTLLANVSSADIYVNTWTEYTLTVPVPALTRCLRVGYRAKYISSWSSHKALVSNYRVSLIAAG